MRWAIGFGLVIAASMYVPLIFGDGSTTGKYWSHYVPPFIIGSAAFAIAFLGVKWVSSSGRGWCALTAASP
jgi:hypothetical protein